MITDAHDERGALLLAFPGNEAMAHKLATRLSCAHSAIDLHCFPDGESLVRIGCDVAGRTVLIVCTLDRPDAKLAPLIFAADAARELGAARVGLVSAYLGYMRQDRRFHPREALSSHSFARMLSAAFDWLITVDPHLHRIASLDALYTIPAVTVHAAPALSRWIREHLRHPLVIGPDSESAQWAGAVAEAAGAPHLVLAKVRRGDRDVEVSIPDVERWRDRVPVLVDDIISSARTMTETARHIRAAGLAAPVCIGVHAVFGPDALVLLEQAGVAEVVTTNSIAHVTNQIDVSALLAADMQKWIDRKAHT